MPTSILATDAYKFSMGQAGFPLRPETFYFSFRRGGFQLVPLDLAAHVRALVRSIETTPEDLAFARAHGYGLTDAMESALARVEELEICAVPEGAWVYEREPILSIRGPSFLVSWLEPQLLWLNHRIQLATHLVTCAQAGQPIEAPYVTATCEEHANLMRETADRVHVRLPAIVREDEAYRARVGAQVRELIAAAGGQAERVFEVGLRSAVCMQQHRDALAACAEAGLHRTSNVASALELGLSPVGTMGHEHVQRWGADRPAFQAMRDMRTAPPSYLLDTFDTMGSGIRAALHVMREREHTCSIRYDSGNKFIQYLHACELFREAGLTPAHVLEDSLDLEATRHFEQLRGFTELPMDRQVYGYGGFIVAAPMTHPFTRDRVSAVYKLSETGDVPRMKFGNEAGLGKQSVPGRPVVWRRLRGDGPIGIVGQQGEEVPDNYVLLSGNTDAIERLRLCNVLELGRALALPEKERRVVISPDTRVLVDRIVGAERQA